MAKDRIDGAVTQSTTWTLVGLLDHTERETVVRYCPEYGGILLRKRGCALRAAVKRHVRRAPLEDIETF